ncbi:hypothetical protein AAVH_26986 [Aphelenchoides avenae]|nr:hypothetical protein AAVH_26986 [Aphelenchus avenae]
MNGGHELPLNVTDVFKHHDLFPLKFYEGYLLRINEVYQKAAEALEHRSTQEDPPAFLEPRNFRLIASNDVSKGRYTGFAVAVEIVDRGMTLEEAMRCEKTRRLLAPEILAGGDARPTSASYSLFRMYYDALKSKLKLVETPVGVAVDGDEEAFRRLVRDDNRFHFVEKATMCKGPVRENGWWELNPFIMKALRAGLNPNPDLRLPIGAFTRLFKQTADGRYVDSRMCVDAFDPDDYRAIRDADWFAD